MPMEPPECPECGGKIVQQTHRFLVGLAPREAAERSAEYYKNPDEYDATPVQKCENGHVTEQ